MTTSIATLIPTSVAQSPTDPDVTKRMAVLWLSFVGFTLSFAAWLMFGVLGIPIQTEFEIGRAHV